MIINYMTEKQLDKEIKKFEKAHPEMDTGWFWDLIKMIAEYYVKRDKI